MTCISAAISSDKIYHSKTRPGAMFHSLCLMCFYCRSRFQTDVFASLVSGRDEDDTADG